MFLSKVNPSDKTVVDRSQGNLEIFLSEYAPLIYIQLTAWEGVHNVWSEKKAQIFGKILELDTILPQNFKKIWVLFLFGVSIWSKKSKFQPEGKDWS